MKGFFQRQAEKPAAHLPESGGQAKTKRPAVRLAIYDSLTSLPQVVELSAEGYRQLIDLLTSKTYEHSQGKGGQIPYTVIREVIENLLHAYFQEAVISVLDNGNTIRISDQGPGIQDKESAFAPGFSTASQEMKEIIRGVGSGLPVAKEMLKCAGGTITIEDNLRSGAVVTLSLPASTDEKKKAAVQAEPEEVETITLSGRQKKVLFLVTELGPVGPSKIAHELNISLSSAYRDLLVLEKHKLVRLAAQGKRVLTQEGTEYLDKVFKS